MAQIDKAKEQIGWFKVVFGLLVAIGVSLFALALLVFVTLVAMLINHKAQKMISRLEDL